MPLYTILLIITNTKNKIPRTKVKLEITFSEPLSLTFANRFKPPEPVNAPDIPSDFPLCNKVSTIYAADTISINISSIYVSPFICLSIITYTQ